MTNSLIATAINLAAEEAAAALARISGERNWNRQRVHDALLDLAETLNRACAILDKPGVQEHLAAHQHSRRMAALVAVFDTSEAVGLTSAEWRALRAITMLGPCTAAQAALSLGYKPFSLFRPVTMLAEAGLLEAVGLEECDGAGRKATVWKTAVDFWPRRFQVDDGPDEGTDPDPGEVEEDVY